MPTLTLHTIQLYTVSLHRHAYTYVSYHPALHSFFTLACLHLRFIPSSSTQFLYIGMPTLTFHTIQLYTVSLHRHAYTYVSYHPALHSFFTLACLHLRFIPSSSTQFLYIGMPTLTFHTIQLYTVSLHRHAYTYVSYHPALHSFFTLACLHLRFIPSSSTQFLYIGMPTLTFHTIQLYTVSLHWHAYTYVSYHPALHSFFT